MVAKFIEIFNSTFNHCVIIAFIIMEIKLNTYLPKILSTESANISSTTTTTTTTTVVPVTSDSTTDGSNFRDTLTPAPESSTSASINLMALEESFGGTTRAPDPVLPTKRRNGLYFLVDWNTFLEVGDEDSEKVNLRFQPKVGDRTRFLPVSVP